MLVPNIRFLDGSGRRKVRNGEGFYIYIERNSAGRLFYPVYKEGDDFGYYKVSLEEPFEFVFHNKDVEIGKELSESDMTKAFLLRVNGNTFCATGQRKGKEWYWAFQNWWDNIIGLKTIETRSDDNGYRVRFSINQRGDSWISEDEVTGSIRLRDSVDDRAILYFVRWSKDVLKPSKLMDVLTKDFLKSDQRWN